MKKTIRSSILLILCGGTSLALAATPSATEILDILNLPASNRRMVITGPSGREMYPSFVKMAFNEAQPMRIRWKALMAAAESGKGKATADLLKAGSHSQWFMRNAALVALSEVNPQQAEKLAIKLLKDKALVVRSAAVETLQSSESSEVRSLLWGELDQEYNFKKKQSLWIRPQIVKVLAAQAQRSEKKIFARLLDDPDQRLQASAIRGLERITGTQLGTVKTGHSAQLVGLWKDYLRQNP